MSLKKGFLRVSLSNKIPTYRYIVGIVIGLLVSFCLYGLLYLTRETIRVFSISNDHDIWVLSHVEIDFYNLIYAFIAVIIGQSSCFIYWFNKPKNVFKARSTRVQTIVNDQGFLIWGFLNWFAKVASMYGFLFGAAGLGGFYVMSFYPSYRYFFILIVCVMFLQSWNALLLTYKGKVYKWMFISAITVSIISYGFSKINFVNYNTLNKSVLEQRLDVSYQLEFPKSDVYKKQAIYNSLPKISLVFPKNPSIETQPILFYGEESVEYEDIFLKTYNSYSTIGSWEKEYFYLQVDKDVSMQYVNRLKKELSKSDIIELHFAIMPSDAIYEQMYYQSIEGTYISINNQMADLFGSFFRDTLIIENSRKISIELIDGEYYINKTSIKEGRLDNAIQKLIIQNPDYVIKFYIDDYLKFGDYVKTFLSIKKTIDELRKSTALKKHTTLYENLSQDQKKEIIDLYPFRYIEVIEKQ